MSISRADIRPSIGHNPAMLAAGRPLTRRLDLNLLELFATVYRLRNLTEAGRQLGLSQPAVSHGLSRLRAVYGDRLFVRMQRGVQPTPFADALAAPVDEALALVRRTFTRSGFEPASSRRAFRIVMSDIGEPLILPGLLQWFSAQAPQATLETRGPELDRLAAELEAGDVDVAIGSFPGIGKRLRQQRLFGESYVYLVRAGHPLLAAAPRTRRGAGAEAPDPPGHDAAPILATARLRRLPHVIAHPPATAHASALERALQAPALRVPIVLRIGSLLGLAPIVAETDLIAPVPSNLARAVAGPLGLVVCQPAAPLPAFEVCLYWHQRYHEDPGNRWLRDGIDRLYRDYPANDGLSSMPSISASGRRRLPAPSASR